MGAPGGFILFTPPPVPLHPLGIRLQTLLGLLDHLNVSLTQSLAHLLGLWSQDFLTQSPNGSVDVGLNLGLLCQLMPQMMRSLLKVFWRPSLFDARALSCLSNSNCCSNIGNSRARLFGWENQKFQTNTASNYLCIQHFLCSKRAHDWFVEYICTVMFSSLAIRKGLCIYIVYLNQNRIDLTEL